MARKHLLTSIGTNTVDRRLTADPSESRAEYARRGASRSMMQSLDEMAENSMRVFEGETIVSLDPELLEPSPFADRIDSDDDEFAALVSAIERAGQSSPVLVRPHPDSAGRFIIVYGHRRARAARQLGINVRAVVKPIEDIAHVIAQGQENTARSDLTFIEKALFARKLIGSGIDKESVKSALTIDDTLLSRMLAVAEHVPEDVLNYLGSARGVGRDRWEELKKLLLTPGKAELACSLVQSEGIVKLPVADRFSALLSELKTKNRKRKPVNSKPEEKAWAIAENSVKVATKDTGNGFTLALKAKDAARFGAYISQNLEHLYEEFQRTEQN
ncbi:plasmid partitioning protein RepB [Rhizobium sp. CCGE 510]|uniref:plasmid partitioning protein RepB n=1 Tax=Rhizobium sp. CCGE 510 TaxID=1132836 RepID=UPI00027B7D99|nr:plasmid partitioning protein RepB [Rhizobium sp. CCGE 510]EJT00843.1 plasmid partitioning protein RepB [Rhizobium sp. CCGE 510]